MKISLCQYTIVWEDKDTNFEQCSDFVGRAMEEGSDLVLFPEMALTGFSMNVAVTAESGKETISRFSVLAKEKNVALGFGWVEKAGNRGRNHYTVVSRSGEVLSDYVKLHPFSFANETDHFEPGDSIPEIITIKGVKIATFICYDLRFPEIYQAVSNEADLIVTAANWPGARREHWRTLLKARAIENQMYIAGVNCYGDIGTLNYTGDSGFYTPQGILEGEIEGEGIMTFVVDSEQVKSYRASFPLKNDRKTDFYKQVL